MITHARQFADEPAGNLRLVDRLCDEFESSWRTGQRPALLDFLQRAPAEIRAAAFRELLALEVGYRRQGGEEPSAAEYQRQFREYSADIERHFERQAAGDSAGPAGTGQAAWPQIPGLVVERVLGRGGMGVVYLAQQRGLKRQVALKLLRSGADAADEERARFRREVEAAASLHHPNIVQIYEVGEFAGQPYCVLEYVPGESLRDLLRRGPQTPEVAAELIAVLASAVDHAHQRGIIHRDLKPANILLELAGAAVASADTEVVTGSARTRTADTSESNRSAGHGEGLVIGGDADAPPWLRPKIADFGLARRLENVDTACTQTGAILGTPAYMAPEQAAGRNKEVAPATDVYALGAMLYELLTGRPPHQAAEVIETLDLIRHQEPVAPRVLQPRVSLDLNTICLKCLAKEPARRYVSAADLAHDLHRFLGGQPIQARPVGPLERTIKLARRFPVVATLSAAIVLIISISFATVSSRLLAERQARRDASLARDAEAALRVVAQQGQATAQIESATAQAISEFLRKDLLEQASPSSGPDRNITLRAVLDRAAERVTGRFPQQPEVEASVRMTLGETYFALGLYKESLPHVERAYVLRAKALGRDERETLAAAVLLGSLYRTQTRNDEAIALLEASLNTLRRVAGDEHEVTLGAMNSLALVYHGVGRSAEAERLYVEAIAIRRRVQGEEHPETLRVMHNLSEMYANLGRNDEAGVLAEQVLQGRRRVLGDDHPDTLLSMNSLAAKLKFQGRLDEAEAVYVQTIEARRRVLGHEHPFTLNSLNNLATVFSSRGDHQNAEPLYQGVLEARRRVLGHEHPDTLMSMNTLANLYSIQNRHAEAEPLLQQVVKAQRQLFGDENPRTATYLNDLAINLHKLGRYAEAEPLYKQVVANHRRTLGGNHPTALRAMNNLALCYKEQAHYEQAEPLYRELLTTRERLLGPCHLDTLASMSNLAALHKAQGRYAEAALLYERELYGRRLVLGDDHPDTLTSLKNLARLYEAQQDYDEAEPLYRELIERSIASLGEAHPVTRDSLAGLGRLHETIGNWEAAAEIQAQRLGILRRHLKPDLQTSLVSCLTALARVRNKLGQFDQAESVAREAQAWYAQQEPNDWQRGKVCGILGESLAGQRKFAEAEPHLLEAWNVLSAEQKEIPSASRRQALSDCSQSLIALYRDWGKTDQVKTWEAISLALAPNN